MPLIAHLFASVLVYACSLLLGTVDWQCILWKAHDQCSEAFYSKEVESYIHSGPSKTLQERQKMLDLLKKFEEQSIDDETVFKDGGEEDSSFAQRFTGIDLGTLKSFLQ